MANFEMLDADEQAFAKKPRPVGWFVAGAVFIGALGFVLGVYMPLDQAHATLLSTHEQLAKKSSELDDTLKKTKKSLEATEATRSELAGFLSKGQDQEKSLESKIEQVSSTANNQLEVYYKSKLVSAESTKEDVRVTIDERLLFRGSSLSGQGRVVLCKVGKSIAGEKDWMVTAHVHAASSDKKFWETLGDRAEALGGGLSGSCGVEGDRLEVVLEQVDDKEASNVVFVLAPKAPPRLRASEAPSAEVAL